MASIVSRPQCVNDFQFIRAERATFQKRPKDLTVSNITALCVSMLQMVWELSVP